MSQFFKKYSLLIWLALLLLIGILSSGAVNFYAANNVFPQTLAEHSLPLSADAIHAEIQRNIARSVVLASSEVDETFIREWSANDEPDQAALLAHLKSAQQNDHAIAHFFVSEFDHQFYDSQGSVRALDADNVRDSWYFKTRDKNVAFDTTVLPELGVINHPVIFISYRVLAASGRLLGISGLILPLEIYSPTSDRYVNQFKQAIYFVDNSGKIILSDNKHNKHGNIRAQEGMKTIADDILANNQANLTKLITTEQTSAVIHSRYLPELGWYLIIEEPPQGDFSAAHWALYITAAIGLIVAVVVLWLVGLSIKRHQQHLNVLANYDGMTGLMNRQSFTTTFQKEVLQLRRSKAPLSFILFDIDFLKKINESHGHTTGDRIIMEIARMSLNSVRGSDLLCRWGGEQFALLLKKCELEQAYKIAEQLRLNVQNYSFALGEKTPVTISLGVAEWAEDETADELFARVDEAMYQAKAEGRNRAEVSYYVSA